MPASPARSPPTCPRARSRRTPTPLGSSSRTSPRRPRASSATPAAASQEQFDDLLEDDAFWHQLAVSLAVFATADSLRTFRLPNRLVSMVEVSDRFHLKPLLRSVTFPQAALVLALAQGSVRLIEVAADVPPFEVHVADLPSALENMGRAPIRRLQGDEGQKVRMRQYARHVDTAIRPGRWPASGCR